MNKKSFKDFVNEDLNVFFNLKEFAEEHELEGETLLMIVIDHKLENNATNLPRDQIYASQEVFKRYKTVYVKTSDFYVPKVDSELILDGESFFVEEAGEEQGIIRILLNANES